MIKNSYKFLDALSELGFYIDDPEDIYPTPYGSRVMDFESDHNLVSIEIGIKKIGFFTDFEDGNDISSEGESTDFRSIPQNLLHALRKIRA